MYNLLSKKYTLTKSEKIIFRKHKYNTLEYIIQLLKQNVYVFLQQAETYKSVAQEILKIHNIQCYAKFINEKYENQFSSLYEPCHKFDWKNDCKKDDVGLNNKIFHHPPCLKYISNDKKYCDIHQDKKYDF